MAGTIVWLVHAAPAGWGNTNNQQAFFCQLDGMQT